jgi:hypothetical protein
MEFSALPGIGWQPHGRQGHWPAGVASLLARHLSKRRSSENSWLNWDRSSFQAGWQVERDDSLLDAEQTQEIDGDGERAGKRETSSRAIAARRSGGRREKTYDISCISFV